jgi:alkylated DNA repair dioxygenase AlkB
MDPSIPRKRRRLFFESYAELDDQPSQQNKTEAICQEITKPDDITTKEEEEPTDVKLARLLSLFPDVAESTLLDVLVCYDGCVAAASAALEVRDETVSSQKERSKSTANSRGAAVPGIQTSLLPSFSKASSASSGWSKPLTKRGKTLYLYAPEDVARHTPCSIIHNFLPPDEANALLVELLDESKTFQPYTFQLFDNQVQSHHTASFYVSTEEEMMQQTTEFTYNGTFRTDVRQLTPQMSAVSDKVQEAVNAEVRKRIQTHYPAGQKLRFQSPRDWVPNAAFVNCYTGPTDSVGYHSDQLTYLGPRAIIGSLSLGVAREFRVRQMVARDGEAPVHIMVDKDERTASQAGSAVKNRLPDKIADAQGQISIHLPHNSLLVMHAEMQEEWKHSIPKMQTISPHPISGNRRINVTYRWYRDSLHPRNTPRCRCGRPAILRCVQRKQGNRGRYMWMCYAGYSPGGKGCAFFQWAEFDDDGEPLWDKMKTVNSPTKPEKA